MLRYITRSRTYQLSVQPNEWNADDTINFSHAKARRLQAEVLYDAIYAATGAKNKDPGSPRGNARGSTPDVGVKLPDGFLDNAGRPVRESSCECERSSDLQLGPIMALVSGPTVGNAVSDPENAIAKLAAEEKDDSKLFAKIFMRVLNRPANDAEVKAAIDSMGVMDEEHAEMAKVLDAYKKELKPKRDKMTAEWTATIEGAKMELGLYEEELKPKLAELDKRQKEKTAKLEQGLADYEAAIPRSSSPGRKSRPG